MANWFRMQAQLWTGIVHFRVMSRLLKKSSLRGFDGWERSFRFRHLPELAVVTLHAVGRVDQTPNIGGIVK